MKTLLWLACVCAGIARADPLDIRDDLTFSGSGPYPVHVSSERADYAESVSASGSYSSVSLGGVLIAIDGAGTITVDSADALASMPCDGMRRPVGEALASAVPELPPGITSQQNVVSYQWTAPRTARAEALVLHFNHVAAAGGWLDGELAIASATAVCDVVFAGSFE